MLACALCLNRVKSKGFLSDNVITDIAGVKREAGLGGKHSTCSSSHFFVCFKNIIVKLAGVWSFF
jgi:hypothetical protein